MGKFVHHYDQLPSTNAHLHTLAARDTLPEGTVVATHHQTAGRGQTGNVWTSGAGENLTLSVLLHPRFLTPRHQFRLTQTVALAVRDTLAEHASAVDIKWPNDILIGGRKVAGILIQNTLSGGEMERSVVGIGINVNQEHFPPELPRATSLRRATGSTFDLKALANQLYHHLESRYLQLRGGRYGGLHVAYMQHFYRLDQPTEFLDRSSDRPFVGIPEGIGERGELVVQRPNGERQFFGMQELRWLE